MEDTQQAPVEPTPPLTRDQAFRLVGSHVLNILEEVIEAHKIASAAETSTEIERENAKLIIAAAGSIGAPLFKLVKLAERPRILRPERSLKVAR
jgi:hypothetical protein